MYVMFHINQVYPNEVEMCPNYTDALTHLSNPLAHF